MTERPFLSGVRIVSEVRITRQQTLCSHELTVYPGQTQNNCLPVEQMR